MRKPNHSSLEYSQVMSMTEPDNERDSSVLDVRVKTTEQSRRSVARRDRTATAYQYFVVRHTTESVLYATVQTEPFEEHHGFSKSGARSAAYAFAAGVRDGDPNLSRE